MRRLHLQFHILSIKYQCLLILFVINFKNKSEGKNWVSLNIYNFFLYRRGKYLFKSFYFVKIRKKNNAVDINKKV